MNPKVILVSAEGDARQAYLNALDSFDIHVDSAFSFTELYELLSNNAYNGVIVDLKTKVKATKEEKELTNELLDILAMVQLKLDKPTGSIQAYFYGQTREGGTLEKFINEECRSFDPRTIRLTARKKIHLNIIVTNKGDFFEKDINRTVTINVSGGGCFIYSIDDFDVGADMLFAIKDLDEKRPIKGEVRWRTAWGEAMQVPGIGVKFEEMGIWEDIRKIITKPDRP